MTDEWLLPKTTVDAFVAKRRPHVGESLAEVRRFLARSVYIVSPSQRPVRLVVGGREFKMASLEDAEIARDVLRKVLCEVDFGVWESGLRPERCDDCGAFDGKHEAGCSGPTTERAP